MSPQPVDLQAHGGQHTRRLLFLSDTSPPLAGHLNVSASATSSEQSYFCSFVRQDLVGSRRLPRESAASETNGRDPQICIEFVHVRMNQESESSFVSLLKLTP